MKKNFFYALMSAIALTSAVGFTACSSDDGAVADTNPTYDGNTVKTQFSISFPQNVASTRMSSATVQAGEAISDFRGMTNIVLKPYLHATDRTKRLGNNITLAANTIIKPSTTNSENSIPSGTSGLVSNNNAVLFQDVTIPLGTSGFLFYGKATGTDGYANGYLTPAGLDNETADISFAPTPIVASTSIDKTKGDALAAYVTSIAQANTKDADENTITWADCADVNNADKTWYSEGLGKLYTNFTSMKAGASAYVQAAVQDLYSSIRNNTDDISKAIKAAIESTTYVESVSEGILNFKDNISGYPGDNNSMPDGTAVLSWTDGTATAVTNGSTTHNVEDMEKIVYPASLYYFVNSGVKVSNSSKADEYKADNATWNDILAKYGTEGTSVTPSTRSVAITNQIQYAVGRLDVTVSALAGDNDGTKYFDRNNEEIELTAASPFTLTGVLIGGQKSVDWKFEPITSSDEFAIYDNTINTTSASAVLTPSTAIGPTYTLALETAAAQEVYVALEFVNNSGQDFQGVDGVVKNGCKFYMVAKLTPTDATGSENTGNKVFKQDFKTIANFTIGTNKDGSNVGFANAYTTIPDLRTPELELGFSVNLKWQSGITFNIDL